MADITGSIGSSLKTPITLMVLLIVGTLLTSSIIVPAIVDVSTDTGIVTTDGAQWIRMDYVEDDSDYTLTFQKSNNKLSVANGSNTQTGSMQDMILYADDLCTLVMADGDMILIGEDGTQGAENTASVVFLEGAVKIERVNGAVSVYDGSTLVYEDGLNQWAYVPKNTGVYGSIDASGLPIPKDSSNVAAYGSFAGIYCYNGLVSRDVGLVLDSQVTSDTIEYVKWIKGSQNVVVEEQELKKETLDPILDPVNPGKTQNGTRSVPTPTYTDGDWGYELDGSDATIVSYSGAGGNVTVPATVGGYTVVAVGKGGANEYVIPNTLSVTYLTISSGITAINDYAFATCKVSNGISIPNTVTTIGKSAFQNCRSYTGNIVIPNSVTSIGESAFTRCEQADSLILSENLSVIPKNAFSFCTALNSISIPASVITIEESAFQGCTNVRGLTFIQIQNSNLTTIGKSAFYGCSEMGATYLPDGVTTIGDEAFRSTKIILATLPSSLTTIGDGAFKGCSRWSGNLVIPNTVTSIGSEAFSGCTMLDGTLTLPNSITEIADGTFYNCYNLTGSLNIPSTVTSIGDEAFRGCNKFTGSLVLPENLTEIGDRAFYGCSGFTGSLSFPDSITEIGAYTFQGCSGFTGTLTIPETISEINNATFSGCQFTGELIIPDNITSIGEGAFNGCNGLNGMLFIPASVETIGSNAFYNCAGFTALCVCSDAVPGNNAFNGTAITQVLNLGSADYTATSYGLDAEEVRTEIDAECYMAIAEREDTITHTGAVYTMLAVIPLVIVASLVFVATYFIRRQE